MADDGVLVADLRAEIERLSRELDLASTEKIQSAQYGLALLEDKGNLQQRCNELETLYETAKHDLDITQEVRYCPWLSFYHLSAPVPNTLFLGVHSFWLGLALS